MWAQLLVQLVYMRLLHVRGRRQSATYESVTMHQVFKSHKLGVHVVMSESDAFVQLCLP